MTFTTKSGGCQSCNSRTFIMKIHHVMVTCSTTWLALWTNQGGFEKREGSVWGVLPNDGLKNTGFWFGNTGHMTPPKDGKVHCLKQFETVEDETK